MIDWKNLLGISKYVDYVLTAIFLVGIFVSWRAHDMLGVATESFLAGYFFSCIIWKSPCERLYKANQRLLSVVEKVMKDK